MKKAKNKSNLSIIKDYLQGERPFVQVGYEPKKEKERKNGEVWKDKNGKEWIQTGATKISKNLYDTRNSTRQICSICKMDIYWGGNRYDEKMFLKTGKCYECLIKEETQMRLAGTFEIYEKIKVIKNQKAFLKELKEKIEQSLTWLNNKNNKIEYVNEDGTTECWTDDISRDEFVKDAETDLIAVNERLSVCDESLKTLNEELDELKQTTTNKS
jgi:hypothetical protein